MAKAPTEIRSLARAHTEGALKVLAGIMNEPDAPPAARVSAATALLDRGWGKPLQQIEHGDPGEFDRMSDDEFHAKLTEKAAALGFSLPKLNGKGNGKTH